MHVSTSTALLGILYNNNIVNYSKRLVSECWRTGAQGVCEPPRGEPSHLPPSLVSWSRLFLQLPGRPLTTVMTT